MESQHADHVEHVNYTDPFSVYGKAIIDNHHDALFRKYSGNPIQLPPAFPDVLSQTFHDGDDLVQAILRRDGQDVLIPCPPRTDSAKVGIIGAGVGGLYAAMMLESLDIDYEILEASDRVGGRLYTYKFSEQQHDYFDVGAMRFPDTPMMKRTFHLFSKLKREAGLVQIPYIFKNENATLLYNSVLMKRANASEDPTQWHIADIPSIFAQYGGSALVKNVVDPFVEQLAQDFERRKKEGWKLMMKYDQYSTRAYMSGNRSDTEPRDQLDQLNLMPYPTPVVDWLETFDKSTAWYDRALSETVLESLAFAFPQPEPVKWWCIDGGAQTIAEKMASLLPVKRRPTLNSRVNAIKVREFKRQDWARAKVQVSFVDSASKPRSYGHVISTVPLPCLRTMDLSGAWLTPSHNTALRTLRYGPAVKIGVKFKISWWTDANLMAKYQQQQYQFGPIVGGQSYTDRMVRTVVYPSYGECGTGAKSTVLMVSYCWTEDANRWSALFRGCSKAETKDIVLRDLVAIHGFYPDEGYKFLASQWLDSYTWSWGTEPESMGAYGFFGPGQFSYAYKHMTQPAALGRLHFAGEALSTRHAWVVGALDASWRAVYEILCSTYPDKIKQFKRMWGSDEDWTDTTISRNVSYSLIAQGLNDMKGQV